MYLDVVPICTGVKCGQILVKESSSAWLTSCLSFNPLVKLNSYSVLLIDLIEDRLRVGSFLMIVYQVTGPCYLFFVVSLKSSCCIWSSCRNSMTFEVMREFVSQLVFDHTWQSKNRIKERTDMNTYFEYKLIWILKSSSSIFSRYNSVVFEDDIRYSVSTLALHFILLKFLLFNFVCALGPAGLFLNM